MPPPQFVVLGLAAGLVGCAKLTAPAAHPTLVVVARDSSRQRIVDAIYEFGISKGDDRAAVTQSVGVALDVRARSMKNQFGYGLDSVFTVQYRGWKFMFLRIGADGREFVTGIELTDHSMALAGNIRCSTTTAADLRAVLGEPSMIQNVHGQSVWSYRTSDIAPEDSVQFYLVRGVVIRVAWDIYVD